ncbi:hypothetical protein F4680DRAFT_423150 [Xylaria scruposa]|nr:hypothetical protein F4680DRAFT_423150 [Xylaria scruposa]
MPSPSRAPIPTAIKPLLNTSSFETSSSETQVTSSSKTREKSFETQVTSPPETEGPSSRVSFETQVPPSLETLVTSSFENSVQDLAPDLPSPPPPPLFYVPGEGSSMSAPASRIRHTCQDEDNPSMPPYSLVASEEERSRSMPTMSIGPVTYIKGDEEPPSLVPPPSAGVPSSHNSPDSEAVESEEEEEMEVKDKGKGKAKDQTARFGPTVESVSDEELPGYMRRRQGKPKVVPFYLGSGSIETVMRKGG